MEKKTKKTKEEFDMAGLQSKFDQMVIDHNNAEGKNAAAGLRARQAAKQIRDQLKAYRKYSLVAHRK